MGGGMLVRTRERRDEGASKVLLKWRSEYSSLRRLARLAFCLAQELLECGKAIRPSERTPNALLV